MESLESATRKEAATPTSSNQTKRCGLRSRVRRQCRFITAGCWGARFSRVILRTSREGKSRYSKEEKSANMQINIRGRTRKSQLSSGRCDIGKVQECAGSYATPICVSFTGMEERTDSTAAQTIAKLEKLSSRVVSGISSRSMQWMNESSA